MQVLYAVLVVWLTLSGVIVTFMGLHIIVHHAMLQALRDHHQELKDEQAKQSRTLQGPPEVQ